MEKIKTLYEKTEELVGKNCRFGKKGVDRNTLVCYHDNVFAVRVQHFVSEQE